MKFAKLNVPALLSIAALLAFVLPANLGYAQQGSLRGNCFLDGLDSFSCTVWDVTDRAAGRYFGTFEVVELHPDRDDYPMVRIYALNDNSFVVEEYQAAGGMWVDLPFNFYADTDDPECVVGGPEMEAVCFRPF